VFATFRVLSVAFTLLAGLAATAHADDVAPDEPEVARPLGLTTDPDAVCPTQVAKVLAIGSSTLGAPLGTLLGRAITKAGLGWYRLAAASSGLARPDFWDWAEKARRLVAEQDPDVVIVQLGSNDFQPVVTPHAVKPWPWRAVRRGKQEWADIYGARIDELLAILGGGDRQRLVIWVGPYAYWGENAAEQGPIIDQLLRDRISTWIAKGGFARYVDVWRETWTSRNEPVMKRALPGKRGLVEIRSSDNVHLNVMAVQALLADPVVAEVLGCLPASASAE